MILKISIKEAREAKGYSIELLSKKLKLAPQVVKDIEEGTPLKGIYTSYETSYKLSIYKALDMPINLQKKNYKIVNNNSQILIIFYFVTFLFFTLASLSNYLIVNYGKIKNISNQNYQDDQIISLYNKETSNNNIELIRHSTFLNFLNYERFTDTKKFLIIIPKVNKESYYKIYYPDKKVEEFGILKDNNQLIINFKTHLYIDISDVSSIDFILFNKKKYKNSNQNRYYLKKFDINKLYNLI